MSLFHHKMNAAQRVAAQRVDELRFHTIQGVHAFQTLCHAAPPSDEVHLCFAD